MIRYSCPKCGVNLKSAEDKAGARTACPRCGEHVTVPGSQPAAGRDDGAQEAAAKGKAAGTSKKPVALYAGIGVAVLAVVAVGGIAMVTMSSRGKTPGSSPPAQFSADVARPRKTAPPKPAAKPAKKSADEEVVDASKAKTGESEIQSKPKGKNKVADEIDSKPPAQKSPESVPSEQTPATRASAEDFSQAPNSEQIYKELLKATVLIIQFQPTSATTGMVGIGTGSLIDKKNHLVLTNFHVVDGPADSHLFAFFPTYRKGKLLVEKDDYLQLIKDNQAIPAFVEQKDPKLDLAIIRLAGLPPNQSVQQISLAHEPVVPGQRVYSVGNPGAGHSFFMMTSGNARSYPHRQKMKVLKGKDNKDNKDNKDSKDGKDSNDIMEVEATIVESQSPVNPGDSGGPVVNDRCELVAVTESAVMEANSMSMFIDVSDIRKFRDGYYKTKHISPPEEAPPTLEIERDLPSLIKALRDHGAAKRAAACDQLESMGPEAKNAVPDLIELLQDKNDFVRVKALKALSEIGFITQGDLPKVIGAMKDPNADARLNAILVVRHMGEEADSAVPSLIERVKDDSPDVRLEAAKALGNLGTLAKAAVPALAEVLQHHDKKHDVRQEAALAIGNILAIGNTPSDDPTATAVGAGALEAGLRDPVREVRLSSLQGLEKMGPNGKTAVPQIMKSMKEKDREMRGQAIVTLGAIGPDAKDAVVPLAQIVVDDKELRVPAGQALGKIKRAAVNVLIKLLFNANAQVRKVSIEALGDMGPEAGPLAARQLLLLYNKENDHANVELIKEALRKINEK